MLVTVQLRVFALEIPTKTPWCTTLQRCLDLEVGTGSAVCGCGRAALVVA